MHLNVNCGYCGHTFVVVFEGPVDLLHYGAGRSFIKANCSNCNSRHAFDLKVRKLGKSAAIKKGEKTRKAEYERKLRAAYELTDESFTRPWSSLTKTEPPQPRLPSPSLICYISVD